MLNKSLERLLKSNYEAIEILLKVDSEGPLTQYPTGYAQLLDSVARAFYRMGAIFTLLSTLAFPSSLRDETILLVL